MGWICFVLFALPLSGLDCFVLFALQLPVCLWWHDYRRDGLPTLKSVAEGGDPVLTHFSWFWAPLVGPLVEARRFMSPAQM